MRLHLELTNRCVLACPACPRTQWQDLLKRPVVRSDLDFYDLDRFLDCDQGKKVDTFLLCGDYGDTIYYPKLFEFLDYFRDSKKYWIHTNGSHRSQKFWQDLSHRLTERDTVTFAIDGLKDTNHLYRINSNWDSVMQAIDTLAKSPVRLHWKTIVFNHNYQQLDQIKKVALDKGCEFTAEKTHRFGSDDLVPPQDLIESNHAYQEIFSSDHSIEIEPSCQDIKTVGCDGILYPCDWIRNPRTFYKSQLWKQKDRWLDQLHIKHTTFDQALLVVQDWADYVRQSSLEHRPTVDILCKMKCRKGCKKTKWIEV
jgi:MoaA/NifB/PqqE/SkfB family radical SAM enzyme